ncbi:MAG TPA: hypothetical protein VEQ85_03190 [Lacipirellulaceae bacterium]|nr:hypothetical protein [Lacipirellulaceae bacterium]
MTIHAQATYRDGVLHLSEPLGLAENSSVQLLIVPQAQPPRQRVIAERPPAPKLTVEEFHNILAEHAVHVGTLPVDFSREDIYRDHD